MQLKYNKEGLEKFITLLACGVFLFSSVRSMSQVFMVLMLFSLLFYWACTHQLYDIPRQIKFIAYSLIAVFLTTIPNMLVNDSLSYGLRIFNQPLSYVVAAIILVLMIGLRVSLNQKMIFYSIGIACFINGAIAFFQRFVLGIERVYGLDIGITAFGNAGSVLALCTFAYFFIVPSFKKKLFFAASAILGCFVMVFSETRGVIMGFGVGFVLIILLLVYCNKQKRLAILKYSSYFVLALCLLMVLVPQARDSLTKRYDAIGSDINQYEKNDYDTSVGLRFEFWKEAIAIIKLSPIIGLSPKSILDRRYEIKALSKSRRDPSDFTRYGRFHNEILNTFARKGILGLLALFAVWISIAIFFWKKISKGDGIAAISMLGILVSYIVAGFVFEPMSAFGEGNYFLMVLVIFASLAFGFSKSEKPNGMHS